MVNLPDLLKDARYSVRMTQQQAADKSGVSPNQISRYETGKASPCFSVLVALLETYNYSLVIEPKAPE